MRNALRVLSSALEAAAAAGRCPANPSRGVPVPRDTGSTAEERTHLSAAEVERVLAYTEIPVDHRAAIVCAIYTGMRAGELWGLRWEDVQLEGADPQVVVRRNRDLPTKSGRTRRILLLPPAWAALRAWRDATLLAREGAEDEVVDLVTGLPRAVAGAYVWPARGRSGPHARGYDAGWATTWREAMGIRPGVRLHDLRHTCAAHLIQGTWGPPMRLEDVQLVLGHASRTTTEIYAHLAPDGGVAALRRVAEAMGRQDGGEDRVMSLPDPVGRRARDR